VLGELHARPEAPSIVAAMRRGVLPAAAAMHALAGAGSATEVPVVLEFVADPSPVVRSEALDAAMALLDPNRPDGRAVEPLAAAMRDARPSAQERARLATLLGRTGAPRAAPLLVELVHAPDIALRIAAIDALGTLGPSVSPGSSPARPGQDADSASAALLSALEVPDAVMRLHAAVALSEAGAAPAREALLGRLDGGDEVDRAALLTALGGVLSRAPTDDAVARLAATLQLAAGPERDAIIEAVGRAPLASAVRILAEVARSQEPADRRTAVAMCAAHAGDPMALAIVRAMLADGEASVRAQAAWSLGTMGDESDVTRLEALARGTDADVASDAAGAVGRIAARAAVPGAATRALCPLFSDGRVYVRANALAALALAGARCGDGSGERAALADDPSEDVRAAAALAVGKSDASAPAANRKALDRCARSDPSGVVASRCRALPAASLRTHAALVYVVPENRDSPRPGAPYVMLLADGLLHAGETDRRGAVFDPVTPAGDVTLRRSSILSR
jgi:HEAT repeat protein